MNPGSGFKVYSLYLASAALTTRAANGDLFLKVEASIRLKHMVVNLRKSDDGQIVFRSEPTLRFAKGQKHNSS